MNEKDYKSIAEITKEFVKPNIDKLVYKTYVNFLADYFEKEGNCIECRHDFETHQDNALISCDKYKNYFNRKQFLKDCGVEK